MALPAKLDEIMSRKKNSTYRAYSSWSAMIQRCTNPKRRGWKNYGGRGISVCESWLSFSNFLKDMGEKPEGYSIDRINPNGDYEPSNCRWATSKEQTHTKRKPLVVVCSQCGDLTNGRSWHGICHACNEYERRNGASRPSAEEVRQQFKAKVAEWTSKPVVQWSLTGDRIALFQSGVAASKALGGKNGALCACLCGKSKSFRGFQWTYAEDDIKSVPPYRREKTGPKPKQKISP